MKAGAGNIFVYNSDGTVAKTIPVTDTAQVVFSGSTVTINPTADLAGGSGFYVNLASGVITDASGNAFAGISGSTAYNFTTLADTIAPILSNVAPLDNASAVNPASNIVLTFSENVQASAGNIVIYNAIDHSVARTISISDGSQVSISGKVITLNPTADLAQGAAYYVNIASGVIKDLSGNDFGGISGNTAYNFTTSSDTIAPLLSGLSPVDNAKNVSPTANFVLTFNENVKAGAGTI